MRRKRVLPVLALLSLAMTAASAQVPGGKAGAYQANVHYRVVSPSQPVSTPDGRVEVAEFFWYGCPHCYDFESHIERWLGSSKPEEVDFVRVPILFNAPARLHARAYYTAAELGILEEIHLPFFREIHVNRNRLTSPAELAALFARFGVDEETFDKTFRSDAVNQRLLRADRLMRGYRITSVPSVTIHGKYVSDGSMARGYASLLELVNELARIEHAAAAD